MSTHWQNSQKLSSECAAKYATIRGFLMPREANSPVYKFAAVDLFKSINEMDA
jgi:hypothetical protein